MSEERKYGTRWVEEETRRAGGGWYYRVGIVEDDRGHLRVRVVKGPVRPGGEIAQVQRVNLRPKDWPWLRETVERMLETLQEMEASRKEGAGRGSPLIRGRR